MTTDTHFLTVNPEQEGVRLDTYLASQLHLVSRTRVQRAIEDGDILVNQHVAKPSYRLRGGDQIEIDLPQPAPVEVLPQPLAVRIVYEDDDIVVVDKPAGMIVHPGAGVESGTLVNALVYHFNTLSETAGRTRPGIVHRLDKETSGLLVVAKNDVAHERLSDQFRDRKVFKIYVALVHGQLTTERGEIEGRIGRSARNRTRMSVLKGDAGRPAHTIFEVVKRHQDFSLLNVQIKTGRTHQIRVHLAHVGHPVVGDTTYGGGRDKQIRNAAIRQAVQALGRHFLHSTELAFTHPQTGERLDFKSPLPEELRALLEKLE